MFDMFNEDNASTLNSSYESNNEKSTVLSNNPVFNEKLFVISVGGSVFIKDEINSNNIRNFCELINKLNQNGFRFVLVIGGGKTARKYVDVFEELGANNYEKDQIGIQTTKLNAMLFSKNIKNSKLIDSIGEIEDINKNYIVGGQVPGQTTDAVGALIAEKLNVGFINLSNVDGIYDFDPKENENAYFFEELSFEDMQLLLSEKKLVPGQNLFVDKHAADILTRSKIKSAFLNGNHLENFENYLMGNSFRGTIVDDIENVILKEDYKEIIQEEIKPKKVIKKRKRKSSSKTIDPSEIDMWNILWI